MADMALVLLFVLLFLPGALFAQQEPPVVINEIAWMGSSVAGVDVNQHWRYEWLELRSTVEHSILLDGWSVELYRQEELYFKIPLSGTLSAYGYFLVAAHDKIPNADVNYANLGGKLVNTGMRVIVKNSIGEVVDEVDARDGWPAGDNETKRTMECKAGPGPALQAEALAKEWQTSAKVGGTPKSQNSKGLKEFIGSLSFFETKKDPNRSFQNSLTIFNGTTLFAVLLALGSSAGILWFRRLLFRRA